MCIGNTVECCDAVVLWAFCAQWCNLVAWNQPFRGIHSIEISKHYKSGLGLLCGCLSSLKVMGKVSNADHTQNVLSIAVTLWIVQKMRNSSIFSCGPFFKSLYWVYYSTASSLCFGFLTRKHVGSWLPNQGTNPHTLALEGEVVTTELPGKSPPPVFENRHLIQ